MTTPPKHEDVANSSDLEQGDASHTHFIPHWSSSTSHRFLTRRNGAIACAIVLFLLLCFRSSSSLRSWSKVSQYSPASSQPIQFQLDQTNHSDILLNPPPDVTTTEDLLLPSQPLYEPIDWSQFAYTQYATTPDYLCNSLMLFERLHALGSRAARVLLYPDTFRHTYPITYDSAEDEARASVVTHMLFDAERKYNVTLKPIQVLRRNSHDSTWAESYTKLLAFNQTEYKRVLNLDSDSTVLQNMDELFLIPNAPIAMPRAYWLPHARDKSESIFSSQIMLVEPSSESFHRIQGAIATADGNTYDMEIVNDLFWESALVMPHRRYDLLTGEFFASEEQHRRYLGDEDEVWNANATLVEAKYLHFSNWPLPKPWYVPAKSMVDQATPECKGNDEGGYEGGDCSGREVWERVHEDFRRRRLEVCGLNAQSMGG